MPLAERAENQKYHVIITENTSAEILREKITLLRITSRQLDVAGN